MVLSALTLAFACGGPSGAPPCPRGGESCPCQPDETCDEGLVCLSNLCVAPEDGDGGSLGRGGTQAEGGETSLQAGSDAGGTDAAGGEASSSSAGEQPAQGGSDEAGRGPIESGGSTSDQGGTLGAGGASTSGGQNPGGESAETGGQPTNGGAGSGGSATGGSAPTGGTTTTGGNNGTGGSMLPPDCTPVELGPLSPASTQSAGFPEGHIAYLDFTGQNIDCEDCVTPCLEAGGSQDFCAAYACDAFCEYDDIWINVELATTGGVNDSDPVALAARFTQLPANYHDRLLASEFGFDVPSGATIVGVELEVRRGLTPFTTNGTTVDHEVMLLLGDEPASDNRAKDNLWSNWDAGTQYTAYGGLGDTWGLELSPDDVNAAGFGVAISVAGAGPAGVEFAYVDHVRITVFYCE